MSVSILEALMNADYNLQTHNLAFVRLGEAQLHNAVTLLKKGYSLHDKVEPLLDQYGDVEDVPEKEE